GQWVAARGHERIVVHAAATGELLGSVPEASPADVDVAVSAAREAFDDPAGWATWAPEQRAAVLERLADELDARTEAMLAAICRQNGMPITIARRLEAGSAGRLLRYNA